MLMIRAVAGAPDRGQGGLRDEESAGEVDADDARPQSKVGLLERHRWRLAGAVDQYGDFARLANRLGDLVGHAPRIGDVEAVNHEGLAAGGRDLAADGFRAAPPAGRTG